MSIPIRVIPPNQLLVCATHSKVYAVDKRDGARVWRNEISGLRSVLSVFVSHDLVFVAGTGKLVALDIVNGVEKWRNELPVCKTLPFRRYGKQRNAIFFFLNHTHSFQRAFPEYGLRRRLHPCLRRPTSRPRPSRCFWVLHGPSLLRISSTLLIINHGGTVVRHSRLNPRQSHGYRSQQRAVPLALRLSQRRLQSPERPPRRGKPEQRLRRVRIDALLPRARYRPVRVGSVHHQRQARWGVFFNDRLRGLHQSRIRVHVAR
ncbi:hypothetical protein BC938DRAFT_482632 [Jimgerdemannia flammicorona]|uniref:Pyrrolo-quinoline quinone repeat domain-containing protein n=1 Tax=Jimgerdemannia flammicorona TaxID=994334 RepID=A0A433QDI9_9FUNG|nr:hypothetical protein BC938DRAFT_482632 [Jimgerdemannia flammicorona]